MEIMGASESVATVASAVIPLLDATPRNRFCDATHRCRVAHELANRGYSEARSLLHSWLHKWPDSTDVIGVEDIIKLDGVDGLLRVVEYLGTLLKDDSDFEVDDWPILCFDEMHGDGSGRKALDEAAKRSPPVASYLHQLNTRDQTRQSRLIDRENGDASPRTTHIERVRNISAAEVIHDIEAEDPPRMQYSAISWGTYASDEGLLAVFDAMLRQPKLRSLRRYLSVFGRRALPTFDPRLLRFAEHEDTEIRRLAHRALSNYSRREIRQLAIDRLSAGQWQEETLGLLRLNYRLGDADIIGPALQVPGDQDQLHDLVSDLVDLFDSNQIAESALSMIFVYEESPCTNCRRRAIKILVNTRTAPTWLLDESANDSCTEIRAIATTKVPST